MVWELIIVVYNKYMLISEKGERPPHPKVNTLVRQIRTSDFFTLKAYN